MKPVVFAIVMIAVAFNAEAQHHAIGVRVGDPLGINYKYYFKKPLSAELVVGVPLFRYGGFKSTAPPDGYTNFDRKPDRVVMWSMRFLYRMNLPKVKHGEWSIYLGGGPHVNCIFGLERFVRLSPPNDIINKKYQFALAGFEGIGTCEYHLENLPIALYAETSLAILFWNGAYYDAWGGIGARYIF